MKLSEERLSEAHRQHTEAILARHVSQRFQRLPMLTGFWLRPDLEVAELAGLYGRPGFVRASNGVARPSRRGASRGGAAHARAHLRSRDALMPARPVRIAGAVAASSAPCAARSTKLFT